MVVGKPLLENRFWKTVFGKTLLENVFGKPFLECRFWRADFEKPFLENRFLEDRFWKTSFGKHFSKTIFGKSFVENPLLKTFVWKTVFSIGSLQYEKPSKKYDLEGMLFTKKCKETSQNECLDEVLTNFLT